MESSKALEELMMSYFSKNLYGIPLVEGPYGEIPLIYADHTASGQPFRKIEDYLRVNIHPKYANTHSNAYAGRMMAKMVALSKDHVRESINANKTDDMVIYTGYGSSTAITHFIHLLDIYSYTDRMGVKPLVLITDFEHNSNFLPWKFAPVETIVVVTDDETGLIDMAKLELVLKEHTKNERLVVASFSAGSNITGLVQDVVAISKLLHSYKCIVSFDYAAVGPYVEIDMHPQEEGAYIDAIFISPHKFLGGPGTPGLLVINKSLARNKCPFYPSGGTVRYTSDETTIFSTNVETKESGGTPNILGCIRCGLVFNLKDRLLPYILQKEEQIVKYVKRRLAKMKQVELLLPNKPISKQVPIFPFVISPLHYNFVVVLLNDLFGIQTRGGVSCSGIYAKKLLHLDEEKKRERAIVETILNDRGVPADYGWCRVTFHYTMTWTTIRYILDAIELVSKFGECFLPLYNYDENTNTWSIDTSQISFVDPVEKLTLDIFAPVVDQPTCVRDLSEDIMVSCMQRTKAWIKKLS
jgi:selenocysteine lyase/cysteine desulfurase